MKTKEYLKSNNGVLTIGGLILVVLIGIGVSQHSPNKKQATSMPSSTVAGQSAILTPVGSASATITPLYSTPSASSTAQQPHPTK